MNVWQRDTTGTDEDQKQILKGLNLTIREGEAVERDWKDKSTQKFQGQPVANCRFVRLFIYFILYSRSMLWWGQMAPWLKISDERGNNRTQDVIVRYRLSATLSWNSLYPIPLSFICPFRFRKKHFGKGVDRRFSLRGASITLFLCRVYWVEWCDIYIYHLWIFNDIYRYTYNIYIAQNGVKWRYAWLNLHLIHVQGFLKVGPATSAAEGHHWKCNAWR